MLNLTFNTSGDLLIKGLSAFWAQQCQGLIRWFAMTAFLSLPVTAFPQTTEIVQGLRFTEGPAVNTDGTLFFSDVPEWKIYTYSKKDGLSLYLDSTGGANGLYFDQEGNLVACAGKARELILIKPDKTIIKLAGSYKGKKLNSPNDLWIDKAGGIYFTDPRYGNTDDLEQDGMHVYYLSPDYKSLTRVINDMIRPNGIIGSNDGKKLYVVDQGAEKTWSYNITEDGILDGKRLFADCGSDGMTVDDDNNIYITCQNKVNSYTPLGVPLQSFEFETSTTNVTYHANKLYVTTQSGKVFRIDL